MMLRKKKDRRDTNYQNQHHSYNTQQFMQLSVKIRTDIINKCMLNLTT